MKKQVFGRKFKRDVNERKALFKGLLTSLVLNERIQTTEEKAKAIKGDFDKIVTKAKKGGSNAVRSIQPHLYAEAVTKMVQDIAPRFATRPGGYTRIIRVKRRFNDDASLVILELVEKGAKGVKTTAKKVEMATDAKIETAKAKKASPKSGGQGKTPAKKAAKTTKETKTKKEPVKKAKKETKK